MRNDPEPLTRADLLWCAGLFLGGWVLRLVHLATIQDSPFFSRLMLDPLFYDEWGRRIAAGDWLGDRPFFQDPLYPYFLGALYAVFGHRFTPVLAIQGLLGAMVAPLVFLATRTWFSRPAARVAGLLAAFHLPLIYYEGLILKTWLAVFLVAVALWLFSRALLGASCWSWFVAGVVFGLASLARGNLVLCVPLLAAWLLLSGEAAGPGGAHAVRGRRAGGLAAGALLLGCGLVLGTTAVRNRAVGGEWILTTSNAGQNFFIGNNPYNTTGEYAWLPFVDPDPGDEERDFAREAERRAGKPLSPRQVSAFWFSEAFRWIRAHPGDWLRLTWRKSRNLWGAYEIPDNLDFYLYRASAPVLRLPVPGWGLVAPLGLVGACLAWRRRGWPRLLLLYLASYALSVVLFFVFSRFRTTMAPALFPLAGHAAVELARRGREAWTPPRKGWPAALRAWGLLLLFVGFVNLPVRATADSWSYRLASFAGLPVRLETSATAHYNLGLSYAAEAKDAADPAALLGLAEVELRLALEQGARYAKVYVELGKVLARQGRDREALAVYGQAAVLEPGLYSTHHAMGLLYRRLGDPPSAEQSFRQALRLEPRHVASVVRLGEVLLDQGRPADAAVTFRYALELDHDNRSARAGLERAGG